MVLALLLAPVLLGVMACLQVPIGDPEQGRIDPTLSGVWFSVEEDALLVLEPYDRRTWLVLLANLSRDDSTAGEAPRAPSYEEMNTRFEIGDIMVFKGWLTTLRGRRFMTWEQMLDPDGERGMEPELWFVWRAEISGDGQLVLRMVDPSGNELEDAATRAAAERILRRDPDNPDFFESGATAFVKVPQSEYDNVGGLLTAFGFENVD